MMVHQGDECPRCHKPQMPKWDEDGKLANARACQACGHVEERKENENVGGANENQKEIGETVTKRFSN